MKMTQNEMDTQALLPVIKDILAKESQKTDDLSAQLVNIGDVAVKLVQEASEIRNQTKLNDAQLQSVIQGQTNVIEVFRALTEQMQAEKVDTEAVNRMKEAFGSALQQVLQAHENDTESLIRKLTEGQKENELRFDVVKKQLSDMKQQLDVDPHQKGLENISEAVQSVKNDIDLLRKEQSLNADKNNKRMDELVLVLEKLNDLFNQLLETTQQNQQLLKDLQTRMKVVEGRLELLTKGE